MYQNMDKTSGSAASTNPIKRRSFITTGGAALAGLGLAGLANTARADQHGNSGKVFDLFEIPMENGDYALPKLPYPYDSLEPHIDEQTMRLHHDIHFNSYKNGLNAALRKTAEFREQGDFPQLSYWESQLAFHGAGYFLHVVFFRNMAPAGTTSLSPALRKVLTRQLGSIDGLKGQFSAAAASVQGSGWAILGYQPFGDKLVILQAEKHQNHTQWNIIPILALDVWEHAYYLKYQNRRGDYIDNWWQVVNWQDVEQRLDAASAIGSA